MKSTFAAGILLLSCLLLARAPAAAQEQVFFPGAEEYRNVRSDFAARVYDCDLALPLDDTSTVRMIRPSGLCFADDRTLMLLDGATATVHRYSIADGRFTGRFGREGAFPGEFKEPRAIVAADDGFAVADAGNHRVQLLDREFAPVGHFGRMGERGERDGFAQPLGMAVGGKRLYICDRYNHEIKVFGLETRGGRAPFGFDRFAPLKSLHHPSGCAAFGEELAVADYGNDRIAFYSIARGDTGRFLRAVGADPVRPRLLSGPVALAFDRTGNLWVADRGNRRVIKMEPPIETGTVAVELLSTTGGVEFVSPVALAVNGQGDLAVLDEETKTLALFRAGHFAKGRDAYRRRDFAEAFRRFALDREDSRRAGAENVYSVFYMAQCMELTDRFREAYDLYGELVARFGYGAVRLQAEYRRKVLQPLLPPREARERR